MKERLKIIFFQAIYWLILFFIARVLFVFYYADKSQEIGFYQVILTFFNGIKLDISATGYLLFFVSFFIALFFWLKLNFAYKIIKVYTIFFSSVIIILTVCDLLLYQHWGFRLDKTPLMYLKTPGDAAASIDFKMLLHFVIYTTGFTYFTFIIYKKLIKQLEFKSGRGNLLYCFVFLFISACLIIPVRGGVGIAPINPGTVYFSKYPFANHAALNVSWNAIYSLSHDSDNSSIHYLDEEVANNLFHKLNHTKQNSRNVLKVEKPNIIIVIWESLSAKIVAPLGGMEHITPNLNVMVKEGINFQNFYANGDRSDKGIVAILSGYPAQPTKSIIKFANKTQSLSFLSKDLNKRGYVSSFYYGGDIDFANMRSYFLNGEFNDIYELDDFPDDQRNSKWGVHDHVVFDRLLNDIKQDTSTFFKVLFTLSSHEPFDVPMDPILIGQDDETRFLNSMIYTDLALGNFITEFKKTKKWDSSLVIVLADHGARHPGNSANYPPEKFHIPMVWLGGALNVRDTVVYNYGSQIDLAATLLNQLNFDCSDYTFSKNILSKETSSFAFYTFNDGFGYFTPSDSLVFDNISKKHIMSISNSLEASTRNAQAIMQVVMNDFNSR